MEPEYGRWCTVADKRYMIVDWTQNYVFVHTEDGRKRFHRSVVSQITDYINR